MRTLRDIAGAWLSGGSSSESARHGEQTGGRVGEGNFDYRDEDITELTPKALKELLKRTYTNLQGKADPAFLRRFDALNEMRKRALLKVFEKPEDMFNDDY